MPNGSVARATSNEALEQRVYNIEGSIHSLRQHTDQQITGLSQQISGLGAKFDERGKIQWPAFSLFLGVILAVGTLAYWPVRENQARQDVIIAKMDERYFATVEKMGDRVNLRFVTKDEFGFGAKLRDTLQAETNDKIRRVNEDIKAIERTLVPRGEHEEKWRGSDARFADVQRRIDEIKKDFGDLYSPRDAFKNMQQRIDDLERLIRARPST